LSWRIDVAPAVDLEGPFELAVDVVLPPPPQRFPPVLLFCLPGGFLTRRYFDLGDPTDPLERTYSFAEHMADLGYAVAMLDHIGVGDSPKPERPEDGYALGPDEIARANQCAWAEVAARIAEQLGASHEDLVSVGVGHSMGSALTVVQQANHRTHELLVLQSFSSRGLPAFLQGEESSYANDPQRARRDVGALVEARFGTPYPGGANEEDAGASAAFSVGSAPPLAERLLNQASTNLLATCGLLTMIPGAYEPYAEKIDVPVFIATGDHDLLKAHVVPAMLPNARETVSYTLPDAWHCHIVANTREQLWDRTAHWLEGWLPLGGT
jgi:pimeloyl-ACP methyl ester carboxylesterase